MDPNANLLEQEEILLRGYTRGNTYFAPDNLRLLELREAMADWLDNDGFEPDWTKAPNARKYYGR